jgi:ubiquinone/menaquinone biosynthesis C-methylase UbiE
MKKQVLYWELAKYYDLIYSFKDYKKEFGRIKTLVSKYKKSEGKELLDVACGTGHHLAYLKDEFSCMGVDISKPVLEVAMKNVQGVVFKQADMTELNLSKQFDVITCLFSSIGYVKTYAKLKRTIQSFSRHLKTGGVVLIEPWFTKSSRFYGLVFIEGYPSMTTYDGKDVKIARLCVSKTRGNLSVQDMHYLIAERGKRVTHFVDRHEMGLFEIDKTLAIMKKTGFRAKFLKKGLMKDRGLFVGEKQ